MTYLLYPKVYRAYADHHKEFGDVSCIPTPYFFFGATPNEEFTVVIEAGKSLIVKFITVDGGNASGFRTVSFELNGQPRDALVLDKSLSDVSAARAKADPDNLKHVGSTMPGMVVTVAVKAGEKVEKGQKLITLEAMKMETTVNAELDATVAKVHVSPGIQVATGDLMIEFE